VDPQPRQVDPGGLDEVARQREKHRAASLNQPVSGFPAITVGELADQVRAATTGVDTAESVTQLLRSGGHSHETIESVLRCLDLDALETPTEQGVVCAAMDPSTGQQRLRTLAQLEALLLKD
jgi:hypothetical protein